MSPAMLRIGLGHDSHRLGPGTSLVLGGVAIPHDRQALGHSDADVLLHAITDALLGAAALGDIGELFPDTDPANRGRDSAEMLRAGLERVVAAGWRIVNLDCVIFAAVLSIDVGQIWLKAKTGEGVGPIGEEQAIAAECVVLIEKS